MAYRKTLFFFTLLIGGFLQLKAQDSTYFLYIQSDRGQLFYVKWNGQLLSSSAEGYLVVPQVKPGDHSLVLGFPRNEYPEEQFNVDMTGGKDRGFLLKKTGDQQFSLYDLSDFSLLNGLQAQVQPPLVAGTASTLPARADTLPPKTVTAGLLPDTVHKVPVNRFRNLLAAVTQQNLPSEPLTEASESASFVKKAPIPPTAVVDSSEQPPPIPAKPDTALASSAQSTTPDSLAGAGSSPNSRPVVPADSSGIAASGQPDSLKAEAGLNSETAGNSAPRILSGVQKPPDTTASAEDLPAAGGNKTVTTTYSPSNQPQFINFSSDSSRIPSTKSPKSQPVAVATLPMAPSPTAQVNSGADRSDSGPLTMINSDCRNLISDEKFEKIHLKIALQDNPDRMLETAGKYLSEDCYSVEQIQILTFLFNTDEYRYKLLEMAYSHTYDSDHFSRLKQVLSDKYYQIRFQAMLKK